MLHRWAVFDVDGTLLPQRSLERELISRLRASGKLGAAQLSGFALEWIRWLVLGQPSLGWRGNKGYLRELPLPLLESLAKELASTLPERIAPRGRRRMQALREANFRILLLSGAPCLLARELLPFLQPDALLCTELEVRQRRLTGRVAGCHPYGKRKRDLLIQKQAELQIDFYGSIVFANHHSDIAHMELFGCPVAVNPTRRLLRHAHRKGWPVEYWTL